MKTIARTELGGKIKSHRNGYKIVFWNAVGDDLTCDGFAKTGPIKCDGGFTVRFKLI